MSTWIAIRTIRPSPRAQQPLQRATDRREGDRWRGYSLLPRLGRVTLRSELFQRQEAVCQHHQADVVVEAPPRPSLEMIQAQLLLHLLIALLHRPAGLPQPDRPQPRRVRRQVAEGVLQLAVGLALDQQPERLPPRRAGPPPGAPPRRAAPA